MAEDDLECTDCGFSGDHDQLMAHDCAFTNVSVDTDRLEAELIQQVEAASVPAIPNLGSLFQDAQDKGIIKPQVLGSGQPT
jgi:hypothetical protein